MSKRAEEAAENIGYIGISFKDVNIFKEGVKAGYEQAEKDTIERAISVLVNLPSLVIPSNYIAYFREKMLEEE